MKDPVAVLREQLQEAKDNKDHKLAAKIRQQLWIAQDNAAGVSMAEVEDLGADISSCIDAQSVKEKTTTTETPPSVSQASGLTSAEKRIRALKKKLQQIEALKEKRELGQVLEKTQLDKISKEQETLDEIKEIESLLTGS
ncbi:eukaryotic translation initiation factor 2A-like [Orbicella faveolata]|uniref:eukaryotic translation initiation factor 2A-like n=1 Tax=Orbicella faveolata TaxID=48498 RepID=UPI0009E6126D|nr:eukaryotic translation initiation factor 2A-like [Orbicella faveolata]